MSCRVFTTLPARQYRILADLCMYHPSSPKWPQNVSSGTLNLNLAQSICVPATVGPCMMMFSWKLCSRHDSQRPHRQLFCTTSFTRFFIWLPLNW